MTDTAPTARLLDDGHVEFTHLCVTGEVTATLPQPQWKVETVEPLTVRPSIGCGSCGWHGWISNGECWPPYPTAKARESVPARQFGKGVPA
jgi:hypothetical protein